jgi:hypothetical protein
LAARKRRGNASLDPKRAAIRREVVRARSANVGGEGDEYNRPSVKSTGHQGSAKVEGKKEKEKDDSSIRHSAALQKGFTVGVYLAASSVAIALQYAAPAGGGPLGGLSLSQTARAAASSSSSSSSSSSIPSDFPAFLKSGGDWTQNRYQDVVSYYSKQVEQLKDKQQLATSQDAISKKKAKKTKANKRQHRANTRAEPAADAKTPTSGEDNKLPNSRFTEGELVVYKDTRTGQNFKMTVLKVQQSRKSGHVYRLESIDGTICSKGVKECDLSLPITGQVNKAAQQVKQRAVTASATAGAAMKSLAMVLVALCVSCVDQVTAIAQQCTAGASSLFAHASHYAAEADFTLSDFLSDINSTFFGFLAGIGETMKNLFSRLSFPSMAVFSDFFRETGESMSAFFSGLSLPSMVVFTDFFERVGETISGLFSNLSIPEIDFDWMELKESLSQRLGPIVRSPPFLVAAPCVAILMAMGYLSRSKKKSSSGLKVGGDNDAADKAISASLAQAAAASTKSPTEISTIPRQRSLFSTTSSADSAPSSEPKKSKLDTTTLTTATKKKQKAKASKSKSKGDVGAKDTTTSPLEVFGAVASVAAKAVGSAVSKANEGDVKTGLKSFGKSITTFSNQFDTSMGKGGKKLSQAAVKLVPAIEERQEKEKRRKEEEEEKEKKKMEDVVRLAQMDLSRAQNVKDAQAWIDSWRKNQPVTTPAAKESSSSSTDAKVGSKVVEEQPVAAKEPASSGSTETKAEAKEDNNTKSDSSSAAGTETEEKRERSNPFTTESCERAKLDPVEALRKWIRN